MTSWNEVFTRHGTDKGLHRYGQVYEFLLSRFRTEPCNLLEIGVFEGGSLRSWEELLAKAKITAIDIDPETLKHSSKRSLVKIVDQRSPLHLNLLREFAPFDVIIDDGCHLPGPTITTFDNLWPMLKVGGIYVIEDMDVWFSPNYQDGFPTILDQELGRLRAECRFNGVKDRITVAAGELFAFLKIETE